MRTAWIAVALAAATIPAQAQSARKNMCPEGPVTLTGTIGENQIFELPDYWVSQSEPCRVHVIGLEAANAACAKDAKFTATGTISHVKEDGEISLVRMDKPEKLECGK